MTLSEKYVSELCEQSFLPFWSFLSPLGKKNKELCDVLLLCDNDIVIISIKDIKVSQHDSEDVKYERWQKKAIQNSVDQIYGAERYIKSVNEVFLADRETIVKLPLKEKRNIYRIAIAFGSAPEFPIETGEFGYGFVHVFDEQSTSIIIKELDTFPDFINYLKAKEEFFKGKIVLVDREVNYLALYLRKGLVFDAMGTPDTIIIDNNLWDSYLKTGEYQGWQQEKKVSYIWDTMIKQLSINHNSEKIDQETRNDLEIATRLINLEPRINRIELGIILQDTIDKKVKGRMLKALPGKNHTYVFMPLNSRNWDHKEKELTLRCLIARLENPDATQVIGISIGRNPAQEISFDLIYLDIPDLNTDLRTKIEIMKKELGYFTNTRTLHSKELGR